MNSRKIDLSASAAPSAISYIEKLSNMPKVNKKVMFNLQSFKKKLKPNFPGKYLLCISKPPLYYPNNIVSYVPGSYSNVEQKTVFYYSTGAQKTWCETIEV